MAGGTLARGGGAVGGTLARGGASGRGRGAGRGGGASPSSSGDDVFGAALDLPDVVLERPKSTPVDEQPAKPAGGTLARGGGSAVVRGGGAAGRGRGAPGGGGGGGGLGGASDDVFGAALALPDVVLERPKSTPPVADGDDDAKAAVPAKPTAPVANTGERRSLPAPSRAASARGASVAARGGAPATLTRGGMSARGAAAAPTRGRALPTPAGRAGGAGAAAPSRGGRALPTPKPKAEAATAAAAPTSDELEDLTDNFDEMLEGLDGGDFDL
jgi:hypothetical protein